MQITPVIMAGGAGTRLWPLSREAYPKQFIKIFNGQSLLQQALLRNKNFSKPVVIVGQEHRFVAAEQVREIGIDADIILEPIGKNTAPCAVLAAIIAQQQKDAVVLLVPADHHITDEDRYHQTVREAVELASSGDIATIGITPTVPHTGYGYIELGSHIKGPCFKAMRFVEKPNSMTASEYLASGNYCWNSGMFVFQPESILTSATKLVPEMINAVQNAYSKSEKDLDFIRLDEDEYSTIKADSIDYAIMEHIANISLVKANFGWSDLGSWQALWEISLKDENGNVSQGDIMLENSSNNYIYSSNKLTTLVGVEDLIVVNTEDATLIASRKESENVKKIVQQLKASGREEAVMPAICYRPWGSYQTIDLGELHKVKRIIVKPGQKLSLQYHHHRAEHWVVVRGLAEVHIGEKINQLNENDSIYIPKGMRHRLVNIGEMDLHLIEVQTGHYLGEDDIVRLNDLYGRG